MRRARRIGTGVAGLLALGALAGILGHRRGWWDASAALPVVGALLAAYVLVETLRAVAAAWRGPARVAAAGRALALGGLGVAILGGLGNWSRSIEAFLLLVEGEEASLAGSRVSGLTLGPLADRDELAVQVRLAKVRLLPASSGEYYPESTLVTTARGATSELTIGPGTTAALGDLRLHQGVFGFAPRLVVQRDGADVFDAVVPFRSSLGAGRALSFDGEVAVASEALTIRGTVDLSGLDERMKGHPRLAIRVLKEGREIGAGELLPGHFAALGEGYRIGFAGLSRWVEIDVARRNYRAVVLLGLAAAAAGLALWGAARARA